MLNAGLDGGSICDRPLGLISAVLAGDAGTDVDDDWIIETGRADRRFVAVVDVVVLVLLVRECVWACGCGVRMLDARANPLGLLGPCGNLVDDVRFTPASVATLRLTVLAEVA